MFTDIERKEGKVFTLSSFQLEQIQTWADEHNETCFTTEGDSNAGCTSKFSFTFYETNFGINPVVYCACGANFVPEYDGPLLKEAS